MITENLPMTCPVCGEKSGNPPLLTRDGNSLRCPKNHCFDISSKGYVNLLLSQHKNVKDPGDSKEMAAALAAGGLPTGKFLFEGFLPIKKGERDAALQAIARLPHTLIFYEAPHRLRQTLAALLEGLGDRPVALCRELTKLHEEMQRTTLSAAVAEYADREPRGEYVLIVGGAGKDDPAAGMTVEDAADLVRRLAEEGQSLSDAARQVARETGYRKGELYRLAAGK